MPKRNVTVIVSIEAVEEDTTTKEARRDSQTTEIRVFNGNRPGVGEIVNVAMSLYRNVMDAIDRLWRE